MNYASFWQRLVSLIVDGFVLLLPMAPFFFLSVKNEATQGQVVAGSIAMTVIGAAYHIGMHAKWGQTVGKMAMKIQLRAVDGSVITFKHAFLRHSVNLFLAAGSLFFLIQGIYSVTAEEFAAIDWIKRSELVAGGNKGAQIFNWATNLWVWSEVIVMLTNKQRRAAHDYIAGTVVVRL